VKREDIEHAIPHRAPFLFLDEVVHLDEKSIVCRYRIREEDELFSRVFTGHYPGFPLVPGVLLCEMMFQAAGVLLSLRAGENFVQGEGTPLLTRIRGARFKRVVRPGEEVEIHASIDEQAAQAYYLKGRVTVNGELAVRAEFACILTPAFADGEI
jgi:3-hydroxyacyl-[acyl-carrier-protein] dehydratase